MNLENKLGPKSYHKWNFFYELIEESKFSVNSYNELVQDLEKYKKHIGKDKFIKKSIILHLYHFVWLYIWIIRDFEEWKYDISWLKSKEDLFNYYEELDNLIQWILVVDSD